MQTPHRTQRRGMLLLVVLLIVTLLALVGTTFSFRMQADLAAVQARQNLLQADQAAQTGIDRAIRVLRDERVNIDKWYNNPQAFRRILVWAPDKIGGSESLADQEAIPGRAAWRFSVVSYQVQGTGVDSVNNNVKLRYGITDEASKINLNTASRSQLLALFDQIKPEDVTSEQLADALIDWRDNNDTPVSSKGAESSYYLTLDPPYRAKNKPFDTVEELLMVKGFNGQILYGEDYNRNGYLDGNEDDGPEGTFPPDNGDSKLDRGLLAYVTVYSWDWNLCNDNKRRVDLNTVNFDDIGKLPDYIQQEIRPEVLSFVAEAKKRGYRFKSVGELMSLQVFEDGSSNYDKAWRNYIRDIARAGRVHEGPVQRERGDTSGESDDEQDGGSNREDNAGQGRDGNSADSGNPGNADDQGGGTGNNTDSRRGGNNRNGTGRNNGGSNDTDNGNQNDNAAGGKNSGRRNQSIRNGGSSGNQQSQGRSGGRRGNSAGADENSQANDNMQGGRDNSRRGGRNGGNNPDQTGDRNGAQDQDANDGNEQGNGGRRRGGRSRNGDQADPDRNNGEEGNNRGRDNNGNRGDGNNRDGRPGRGDGQGGNGTKGKNRGTPIESPVTAADLPVLMDRLTASSMPAVAGLINVNTASPVVIRTIPGLTPNQADAILAKRITLDAMAKNTPAWLVTSGAVDPTTFTLIANQVTTRSIQFTIDSVGFADHVGTFKRVQAIVEMRGQLAQIKYYRDITSLGMGYPVRDDERSEGFAFTDR